MVQQSAVADNAALEGESEACGERRSCVAEGDVSRRPSEQLQLVRDGLGSTATSAASSQFSGWCLARGVCAGIGAGYTIGASPENRAEMGLVGASQVCFRLC